MDLSWSDPRVTVAPYRELVEQNDQQMVAIKALDGIVPLREEKNPPEEREERHKPMFLICRPFPAKPATFVPSATNVPAASPHSGTLPQAGGKGTWIGGGEGRASCRDCSGYGQRICPDSSEGGAEMHVVQAVLGHCSVAPTERYHADFSPEPAAKRALAVLEKCGRKTGSDFSRFAKTDPTPFFTESIQWVLMNSSSAWRFSAHQKTAELGRIRNRVGDIWQGLRGAHEDLDSQHVCPT